MTAGPGRFYKLHYGILSLALAWGLLVLVVGSDAGMDFLPSVLAFVSAVVLIVFSFSAPVITWAVSCRCPPARTWLLAAFTVSVVTAIGFLWMSGTAFRTRYVLSMPALDAFVASLPPAIDSDAHEQVGLFIVRRVVKEKDRPEVVYLYTADLGFGDTSGLAYSPRHEPPGFGESAFGRLDQQWWHMRNSW